jgi:hypothetical protein
MIAGRIKPTHMMAVVGNDPDTPALFHEPLCPEFCVRPTHAPAREIEPATKDAYEWHAWPHSPQDELEIACRRLREAEDRIEERTAVAKELTKEVEERTGWALRLEKEFEERTAWALRLDKELAEQTARAQELNLRLEQLAWARRLDRLARKLYRKASRKY